MKKTFIFFLISLFSLFILNLSLFSVEKKVHDVILEEEATSENVNSLEKEGGKKDNADVQQENSIEKYEDKEGIIILSPGEVEEEELEKYLPEKKKISIPETENKIEETTTFDYEEEKPELILVETKEKEKFERAGYILVEKAGFISKNFKEDGIIYTDSDKEILTQNDIVNVKILVGKKIKTGDKFIIYNDNNDIYNPENDEYLGKLIDVSGVLKIIGKIENNVYKAQIIKSYSVIKNKYKIKKREDIKRYHTKLAKKVKPKNLKVSALIIKSKISKSDLATNDIVYINKGLRNKIYPGIKMNIYRVKENEDGKKEYENIGKLLILNSTKNSATGIIIVQSKIIKIGDTARTY